MFFFYDPSWSELIRVQFYFIFIFLFDPSWSELILPGLAVPVDPVRLLYLPRRISHFLPYPPPPPGGGTASSFSSQITNSWGQGCLNSQAPAKEIKIGGQMDGAVGIDLCIRKSSSLSICFFGWDALNNLITHIQVRHSIKIFSQF